MEREMLELEGTTSSIKPTICNQSHQLIPVTDKELQITQEMIENHDNKIEELTIEYNKSLSLKTRIFRSSLQSIKEKIDIQNVKKKILQDMLRYKINEKNTIQLNFDQKNKSAVSLNQCANKTIQTVQQFIDKFHQYHLPSQPILVLYELNEMQKTVKKACALLSHETEEQTETALIMMGAQLWRTYNHTAPHEGNSALILFSNVIRNILLDSQMHAIDCYLSTADEDEQSIQTRINKENQSIYQFWNQEKQKFNQIYKDLISLNISEINHLLDYFERELKNTCDNDIREVNNIKYYTTILILIYYLETGSNKYSDLLSDLHVHDKNSALNLLQEQFTLHIKPSKWIQYQSILLKITLIALAATSISIILCICIGIFLTIFFLIPPIIFMPVFTTPAPGLAALFVCSFLAGSALMLYRNKVNNIYIRMLNMLNRYQDATALPSNNSNHQPDHTESNTPSNLIFRLFMSIKNRMGTSAAPNFESESANVSH